MPNENLGFVSRWTFGDCNDVEAKRLLLHKRCDPEYLSICLERGIMQGRIIHGKGIGTLREVVHSQLRSNRHILSFALGEGDSGGWGSTSFTLKPIRE